MRTAEERREYMRKYMQAKRVNSRKQNVSTLANTDTDTETEIDIETEKNTCPEPLPKRQRSRAAVPVVSPEDTQITIPIIGNDGLEYPITKAQAAEWASLFPNVEIDQTLREIRAWNLATPKKRKTVGGVLTHVTAWLQREQNKGGKSWQ
jgi:hypothetical protein